MIIVIPAYCPDAKLIDLLKKIKKESEGDIVVVDDGSGKEYETIFQEAARYAKVISYEVNQGKGHALKEAFEYLKGQAHWENEVVVTADADGQHTISDIIHTADALQDSKAALMLGARQFTGKVPLRSELGNRITRNVFRWATGRKLMDTQTGLRAFWFEELPTMLQISGERYEYEMNVLLEFAKMNLKIEETMIETIYLNNNASSHFRAVRDSICIYKNILQFALSSLLGFLVDFVCYWMFTMMLANFGTSGVLISNVAARVISATVNFKINQKWVFQKKEEGIRQAVQYFLLAVGILFANSLLLLGFVQILGLNKVLAKILVEMILFIVSFWVQQKFIFGKAGEEQ